MMTGMITSGLTVTIISVIYPREDYTHLDGMFIDSVEHIRPDASYTRCIDGQNSGELVVVFNWNILSANSLPRRTDQASVDS
jgi:hypothetical protein